MGFKLPEGFAINSDLNMSVREGNQVAAVLNPLSSGVLNSTGFALLENVLTVRSQNHEEFFVADVLQIRETLFLPSGSFPLLPCDAIPLNQFSVDVAWNLVVRNLAGHIPPLSSANVGNGQLLNETFQCRGFAFVFSLQGSQ